MKLHDSSYHLPKIVRSANHGLTLPALPNSLLQLDSTSPTLLPRRSIKRGQPRLLQLRLPRRRWPYLPRQGPPPDPAAEAAAPNKPSSHPSRERQQLRQPRLCNPAAGIAGAPQRPRTTSAAGTWLRHSSSCSQQREACSRASHRALPSRDLAPQEARGQGHCAGLGRVQPQQQHQASLPAASKPSSLASSPWAMLQRSLQQLMPP